ncbi:fumarylacetoacetate hydrolase family protein [Cohnella faecalis]|uniref:fumarylacetoacetate hydrolase family protein n=1 Tax=Cohnella faecalis TaxID=2315694 RepID=UPI0036245A32
MNEFASFQNIRNVYCVGRNYRLHAAEMGNEVPTSPMLFTKPTHAVVPLDGRPVLLPGAFGSVHYEAELVLLIGKAYEPGMKADDLIVGFTVGLDLTLRDVQDKLKAKGQPWLAAKGFRSSAPIGRWMAFPGEAALSEADFGLRINGREAQRGNVRDMVFGLQQLVEFTGKHYGLGPGDVLFTGTPQGVGALQDGDMLEVRWNEESVGTATIKLEA